MKISRIYRLLCCLLLVGWFATPMAHSQEPRAESQEPTAESLLSDNARIYLVTCSPGEALYERFGHTAIMIIDPDRGIEDVYNYGIFDFNTSHFYWKFVRGETYYQLGKESARWFITAYTRGGRTVNLQELHLSTQARELFYRALVENYKPENRVYLYNFVYDNCATRPLNLLLAVLDREAGVSGEESAITSSYQGAEGVTYRKFIQRYIPKGAWADLGINLLFGPKADKAMHGEQRLFLPEEVMNWVSEARYPDGTPLVEGENIEPFEIERIPWYGTWYFGLAVLFVIVALISYHDRRILKRTRWLDYVLYAVYGVLLVLVTFLTFFSIHPLVGYGSYLLIIPSVHLCARIIYRWRS